MEKYKKRERGAGEKNPNAHTMHKSTEISTRRRISASLFLSLSSKTRTGRARSLLPLPLSLSFFLSKKEPPFSRCVLGTVQSRSASSVNDKRSSSSPVISFRWWSSREKQNVLVNKCRGERDVLCNVTYSSLFLSLAASLLRYGDILPSSFVSPARLFTTVAAT